MVGGKRVMRIFGSKDENLELSLCLSTANTDYPSETLGFRTLSIVLVIKKDLFDEICVFIDFY
jgi:hypothetical protein